MTNTPKNPESNTAKSKKLMAFIRTIKNRIYDLLDNRKTKQTNKTGKINDGTGDKESQTTETIPKAKSNIFKQTKEFVNTWKTTSIVLALLSITSYEVGHYVGKQSERKLKKHEAENAAERVKIKENIIANTKKQEEEKHFNLSREAGVVKFDPSLTTYTLASFPDTFTTNNSVNISDITVVYWPQSAR